MSYTLIGKGLGFWNTMPTRRRRSFTSILPYMSTPSSAALPVILTPGTRSFMRLSDFSSVLLPQPDGPISAETSCSGIPMFMFFSA